jgi:serine/threonine protein kinase
MTSSSGESTSSPPHLADRYRLVARVGLGGTAVVYRAVDLHTDRVVAVKVLRTNGPLIPEAAARFKREAYLAAALAHPHIVRVLDYGYTLPVAPVQRVPWEADPDQPVPYVAMEYIYGSSLKEIVRKRSPLPFDWVWRIGEQLCSALASAHAMGVVHRDIKPQNVMIADSRIELIAKLTDFGIARQVGGDMTTLTADGQVIGTPDYLSPEQVLGEPGGPSSDLYSLGIVLYELATAHLPFQADTPLAAASRRMVADPPPLTAYRREVPRQLQDVILLALRREPEERFANAVEFAQGLRWSHERAGAQPTAERGSWVLGATTPTPSQPASGPVESASTNGAASPAAPPVQSTIMRVAPITDDLQLDAPSATPPPDAPGATPMLSDLSPPPTPPDP